MRLCNRLPAPVSLQPGTPLSRSVSSSISYVQLSNVSKQAEKQPHHSYIGYDPTGHHGFVPAAEQNHARRGATPLPIRRRQPAFSKSPLPPNSPLARRHASPVLSPSPVQAKPKWIQNIQNVHKFPQQHPGPIRGPAPIPISANGHHARVHIAKMPIHPPPLMAGKFNGAVHDIQKSNRWDPQYHAGVKAPGARPY